MNLYLEDFEPFLVVLGDSVSSDQLDVVAVARVAHDVVLHRESSLVKRRERQRCEEISDRN